MGGADALQDHPIKFRLSAALSNAESLDLASGRNDELNNNSTCCAERPWHCLLQDTQNLSDEWAGLASSSSPSRARHRYRLIEIGLHVVDKFSDFSVRHLREH